MPRLDAQNGRRSWGVGLRRTQSWKLGPWVAFALASPALVVSCGGRTGLWLDVEDAAPLQEEASLDSGAPVDARAIEASVDATADVTVDAPPDTLALPDVVAEDSTRPDASPDAGPDAPLDAPDADGSCPILGNGIEQLPVPPAPLVFGARDMAVQPDGKILVLGFPSAIASPGPTVALARYGVDGALDATFGTSGIVTIKLPLTENWPIAVVLQDDGQILVTTMLDGPSYVVRLSAAGVLDTSFGVDGVLTSPSLVRLWALHPRPDGTIVAVGDSNEGTSGVYLTRYTSAGGVDLSFGAGGSTTTGVPSSARAFGEQLAFQTDGKIVVAGRTVYTTSNGGAPMLMRYTADGVLDPTFGTAGVVVPISVPGQFYAVNDMVLQSTGAIVVALGDDWNPSPGTFTLERFTPAGALDTTFGTSGSTVTSFGVDLALLAGDALLVGGTLQEQAVQTIALARYTSDGLLDSTYADGGVSVMSFPGETQNNLTSIALGPQGIVLAGVGMAPSTDGGGGAAARSGAVPAVSLGAPAKGRGRR